VRIDEEMGDELQLRPRWTYVPFQSFLIAHERPVMKTVPPFIALNSNPQFSIADMRQ